MIIMSAFVSFASLTICWYGFPPATTTSVTISSPQITSTDLRIWHSPTSLIPWISRSRGMLRLNSWPTGSTMCNSVIVALYSRANAAAYCSAATVESRKSTGTRMRRSCKPDAVGVVARHMGFRDGGFSMFDHLSFHSTIPLRLLGVHIVQSQVQPQHVHARFAENPPLRRLDKFLHQRLDLVRAHAACGSDTSNLQSRRFGTDMWVKPARRSKNHVRRHGRVRHQLIPRAECHGVGGDIGLQGLARRAEVARARGHRGIAARGRPRPEVLVTRELLREHPGTDHLTVTFN